MILRNPTDHDVSIGIGGVEYSVEAGGTVSVPQAVGVQWVRTHAFLENEAEAADEVVEAPAAVEEEEEGEEEASEESPEAGEGETPEEEAAAGEEEGGAPEGDAPVTE